MKILAPLFAILTLTAMADTPATPDTPTPTPVPSSLTSSSWIVTTINDSPLTSPPNLPTIIFDADGQISGNATCNGYGGTFSTDGDKISISRLRITRMMCDEPSMQRERLFSHLIQTATTWQITPDKTLILQSPDGSIKASPKKP